MKIVPPPVGSIWHWTHLPSDGRIVRQVVEESFGAYVLYLETRDGDGIDLKVCTLAAWHKAVNGRRPYLSALRRVE